MAPRTKDSEKKAATPAKSAAKGRKPATRAKPGPEALENPAPRMIEAEATGAASPTILGAVKLKDLVDQVVEATGGKRADVKPTIEALLTAMGSALATGKALAVPPLGKIRVVKNKGAALTLKLRLADGPKAAGLALADDGEDG